MVHSLSCRARSILRPLFTRTEPMPFRIGLTRDYLVDGDRPAWPGLGRDGFEDEPGLQIEMLPERVLKAPAALIDQYDALISSTVRYTPASFEGVERLA